MEIITGNIESLTIVNYNYRKVIATSDQMQLVLMSLKPLEEIGMEKHSSVTQFFRVESGSGILITKSKGILSEKEIKEGSFVFVPGGNWHNVINTSKTEYLKLYTLYSPPNHPENKIEKNKF
jgi:mannose-6-phosphate isomerase-like protein (cupin superfamily)